MGRPNIYACKLSDFGGFPGVRAHTQVLLPHSLPICLPLCWPTGVLFFFCELASARRSLDE